MKRTLFLVTIAFSLSALFALMIYGLFYASDPKSIPSALVGKPAPSFIVNTFKGEEISLDQFLGKPIVLNFWASWCLACREEAYILEKAHQTFSQKGAVFIGIATNDTREKSISFIEKYKKTFYLAPDTDSAKYALDYGVTGLPETFFINKHGVIEYKHLGTITAESIETFLQEQLKTH